MDRPFGGFLADANLAAFMPLPVFLNVTPAAVLRALN
jgi:hypothetical protein